MIGQPGTRRDPLNRLLTFFRLKTELILRLTSIPPSTRQFAFPLH